VENSFGNIQILRSVTAQGDVLHQPTTLVKGPHAKLVKDPNANAHDLLAQSFSLVNAPNANAHDSGPPSAKTSCAYPVPWKNIKTKALRKSLLRQNGAQGLLDRLNAGSCFNPVPSTR
jgi:hypothetical protein